ncbi:MAG: tetratricopeptide repeat protein [Caldilineae bacterium]|nr:tetratricopeptide repeat protein [Caldilineae bacterium]
MAMPSGTVTFLFTDVVGSTRLWETQPEPMRSALARHDRLLRAAIEARQGHVFKTVGDAFCAAFGRADDALGAALAIQRGLASEPEGEGALRLQVRTALHTGMADERDGDYFGQHLNRCARLLDAGHGQQILLSRVTQSLLGDALPEGLTLRDLGRHRLRDLSEPEQVFQVVHAALPDDFPPLRSLDGQPNNLPQVANRLIGRATELEAIARLLDSTRLVTLTGAGGSGKTRLALQVAADRLDPYPDGVWLVELAALDDGRLILDAIAGAIGLREAPGQPLLESLVERIGDGRVLLLLDNCEHLIDACAALVQQLLQRCPGLSCLSTSREGLRIGGELLYPVPPLSLPETRSLRRGERERLRAIADCASVQLFVERAQAILPDFALGPDNAEALAEICRRLDGVALAIELAAARVRILEPKQIATRLDDHLRLLTGGRRGVLPRQQTMRAAVEWSYGLLDETERLLLARLGVFAGGWTLELAEQVCAGGAIEDWELVDLLSRLVEKSLVVAETSAGAIRYRMLASIRQLALEKLEASDEATRVRLALLDALTRLALAAEPELAGPEQIAWLDRLQREHDTIRGALGFAVEAGETERGLTLAAALMRYWQLRGHLREGLGLLRALLAAEAGDGVADRVRAKALNAAGVLAYFQGDYTGARRELDASLQLWKGLDDPERVDQLASNLGVISRAQGDVAAARAYMTQSLAWNRSRSNPEGIVFGLWNLSMLAHEAGQLDAALTSIEEALALERELGEPHNLAGILCTQAEILWLMGQDGGARAAVDESLALYQASGSDFGAAEALELMARIETDAGRLDMARARIETCLVSRQALGDAQGIADALTLRGAIHLHAGEPEAAAADLAEGLARARQLGFRRGVANGLLLAGQLELGREAVDRVRASLEEALPIIGDLGSRLLLARALEQAAIVAARAGRPAPAGRLLDAADALCLACKAPRPAWRETALGDLRQDLERRGAGRDAPQAPPLDSVGALQPLIDAALAAIG